MMLQTCTSLQEWRATETRTLSRSWPKKRLRISCNRNANCCRLLPLFPPSRLHRLLRFSKHLRSLPLHQSLPSSRTWQEHPLTQSTVRSLRSLPPLTREAARTPRHLSSLRSLSRMSTTTTLPLPLLPYLLGAQQQPLFQVTHQFLLLPFAIKSPVQSTRRQLELHILGRSIQLKHQSNQKRILPLKALSLRVLHPRQALKPSHCHQQQRCRHR